MAAFTDRKAIVLVLLSVLLTLPFLRTTGGADTFYTTDANVYYRTSELLLHEQSIATQERTLGWVLMNETYYPSMPIGYSLLAAVPGVVVDALSGPPAPRLRPEQGISPVIHSRYVGGAYWVDVNGSYSIDIGEEERALRLEARIRSLDEPRHTTIYVNGQRVHEAVYRYQWENLSLSVPLENGRNVIRFASRRPCTPVEDVHREARDAGCHALVIRDVDASLVPRNQR